MGPRGAGGAAEEGAGGAGSERHGGGWSGACLRSRKRDGSSRQAEAGVKKDLVARGPPGFLEPSGPGPSGLHVEHNRMVQ